MSQAEERRSQDRGDEFCTGCHCFVDRDGHSDDCDGAEVIDISEQALRPGPEGNGAGVDVSQLTALAETAQDLEAENQALRERVDELEARLEAIEGDDRLAEHSRDLAVVKQTLFALLDADEFDDLADDAEGLRSTIERIESDPRVDEAESQVAICERVAHDEIQRRLSRYGQSSTVDVSEMRDIVDREYEFEPQNTTIIRAFQNLADREEMYRFERGDPGPHTKNTRLSIGGDV